MVVPQTEVALDMTDDAPEFSSPHLQLGAGPTLQGAISELKRNTEPSVLENLSLPA